MIILKLCLFTLFISGVFTENAILTNEDEPGKGFLITPKPKTIALTCNDTSKTPEEKEVFEWTKDELPLNESARIQVQPDSNTLKIYNATTADCGSYKCSMKKNSDTFLSATIKVQMRPFIKELASGYKSLNIVQGDMLNLTCDVMACPIPNLIWYKGDDEINDTNTRIKFFEVKGIPKARLIIDEVDFNDRAEYTCAADNGVGDPFNRTILVRVKDKLAALWPFLGICAEVAVLCTIIFIYEKKRVKPEFEDSDTDQNPDNKNVPEHKDKGREVRQRK